MGGWRCPGNWRPAGREGDSAQSRTLALGPLVAVRGGGGVCIHAGPEAGLLALETSGAASLPSAVESEEGSQDECRLERPEAGVSGEPLPGPLGSAASPPPHWAPRAPRPVAGPNVCRSVAAPDAVWKPTQQVAVI